MSDIDDAAQVVHHLLDRLNAAFSEATSLDAALALYASDCVWREAPTAAHPEGRAGGIDEIRRALTAEARVFRDRKVELHDVIADGNEAAARFTWFATVAVDGTPLGPAGTRVSAEIASFVEVRNGKVVEQRDYVAAPRLVTR